MNRSSIPSEKPLQNSQHWDNRTLYLSSCAIHQKNHCRTVSIETHSWCRSGYLPLSEKPLQNSQHWDIFVSNKTFLVSLSEKPLQNSQHWDLWFLWRSFSWLSEKPLQNSQHWDAFFPNNVAYVILSEKPLQNSQHWDIGLDVFTSGVFDQKNHCRTVSIETKTTKTTPYSSINQKNHCRTVSIETFTLSPVDLWVLIRKTIAEQSALRQCLHLTEVLRLVSEKPLQNSQHWDMCSVLVPSLTGWSEKPLQNSQHWDISSSEYNVVSINIRKTIAEQSALRPLTIFLIGSTNYQKNHCRTVSIETFGEDWLSSSTNTNQKNHCRTVSIETCCRAGKVIFCIRKTIAEQSALRLFN